jgi:hypothetical protein
MISERIAVDLFFVDTLFFCRAGFIYRMLRKCEEVCVCLCVFVCVFV